MSIFSRFFRSYSSKGFTPTLLKRGFTLIELMVVVAIVVVLTGLILLRHSRFDSSTLLRSLSYSIALSMRQAQVYGTSVRGVSSGGSTVYAPGFGVYFTETELTRYFLFADTDGNRAWAASENVTTHNLGNAFTIKDICAVTAAGVASCTSSSGIDWLTIYFRRPDPDAVIYTSNTGATYSYAYVQVQSGGATDFRSIKITSVGQISVCGSSTDVATC